MSDIWHTPPQTPDVFKSHPIIVVYEAGDEIEQMDSTEYSDLVGERYVNRWCYVDELIKENKDLSDKIGKLETELDRTRKALDIAVDALKQIKDGKTPVSLGIYMDINDALEQITALEQKDVK